MDWSLFRRIADELGGLGYGGWFAFHNYNEPLLNERITDEIAYLRRAAPQARPAIYSNGDVLNSVLFERLVSAGVAYVRVTRYPRHADSPPSYEVVKGWLDRAGLLDIFAWRFEPVGASGSRAHLASRPSDDFRYTPVDCTDWWPRMSAICSIGVPSSINRVASVCAASACRGGVSRSPAREPPGRA